MTDTERAGTQLPTEKYFATDADTLEPTSLLVSNRTSAVPELLCFNGGEESIQETQVVW